MQLAGRVVTTGMLLFLACCHVVWGVEPIYQLQFRSQDALPGDEFGRSVALQGTLGLIGAPFRDEVGVDSGAAYLFDVTTGTQLFKFVPQDAAAEDQFGISVSLSERFAVIGALHDDDAGRSSGSAYVFDVANGEQVFKLTASDATAGDEFGVSVGVQGSTAIVGAHKDQSGSAYFFDLESGAQTRKVRALDAAPDDLFGVAVALDGPNALIGARYDDDLGIASGSAYILDIATGEQKHKLNAIDGAWGDRYGMYLDISGNRAVVASRYDDDVIKSSGSAYIYDVETGEQLFKIVADDADPTDHFGSAISVSGDYAVVGAVNNNDLGSLSGSAYVYDVNSGEQLFKLTGEDTQAFDQFGQSVAIDGARILVGASMINFAGSPPLPSGKAYVFLVPEPSALVLVTCGLVLWSVRRMLSRASWDRP